MLQRYLFRLPDFVAVVDIGGGKDLAFNLQTLEILPSHLLGNGFERNFYFLLLGKSGINKRERQPAVALRGSYTHGGYEPVVAHAHIIGVNAQGHELGVLMGLIHLEHVIGRGQSHPAEAVGKNHRLEHVDYLCDIGHLHAVERVEGIG